MTRRLHPAVALLGGIALIVAACGGATPSASPLASTVPSPSAEPTAVPSATSTPSPSPTASVAASPSQAAGPCAVEPQTGLLPSDRFTSLVISSGPRADLLTFVFGNESLPGPAGPPTGSLEVALPPFTEAASGRPIRLLGEHAIAVKFNGMSLSNDVGQPTYDGPSEYKPNLPAVKDAVLFDASEGQIGWYVGYDGDGCVTLARAGRTITVSIAHD
jgi:hypothetical protein